MTKVDPIEIFCGKIGLGVIESAEIVEQVFEIMKRDLESVNKIKIPGFGNFVVHEKGQPKGRNPQTGEAIIISGRRVVTFKPSNVVRKALNRVEEVQAKSPS